MVRAGSSWLPLAVEPVLLRQQPEASGPDVAQDPPFRRAGDRAVAGSPDDVRAIMDWLAALSDAQAAKRAGCHIYAVLFRCWRLPGGRLSEDDAARALERFDNPLAITMRRTVAVRLYPDPPSCVNRRHSMGAFPAPPLR